jgi:thiol-disulfide isomerase/thioredoxin
VTKHREILSENKAELPLWYLELENKRLLVLGAHLKLNSLSYRKRMLKFDDEIPPHYVESIVKNVPYQDIRLMGFSIFSRFMFDYSVQSFNPLNDTSANSLKERYKDSLFTHTIKSLPKPYNDYALMSHLGMVLQYDRTKVKTEWIELVTDTTFKNYLNSEVKIEAKLPKGALSPQFSGLTVDSNMINSNQFKDSVLLINFWASFCSPCIANFPHENELAIQYQNQPVKIINMCIETDFEMFKVFVEMHDLKTFNLFADKKRTASLKKDFDIHGIPHSILIDKNGLVVKNKCSVRGDGIVVEIDALLK